MATKSFSLNTDPHIAEIGDAIELLFLPEVMGDEYLDHYGALTERYQSLGIDLKNPTGMDAKTLRAASAGVRDFLVELMVPESAKEFSQWDVVDGKGKVVASFLRNSEATAKAEKAKDHAVVFAGMRLPDRVIIELLEWSMTLYGAGRPPTSSIDSASSPPPRGTRGTASSRSKGSTRTRGR